MEGIQEFGLSTQRFFCSKWPIGGRPSVGGFQVWNQRIPRDDQHHLPLNNQRGDKFARLNIRVSKFFNFGEQRKLGLFFEAFNVFKSGQRAVACPRLDLSSSRHSVLRTEAERRSNEFDSQGRAIACRDRDFERWATKGGSCAA